MNRRTTINTVYGLIFAALLGSVCGGTPEVRAQAWGLPAMSPESKACVECHKAENTPIYQQWGNSKHYRANVGCYECHMAQEGSFDNPDFVEVVIHSYRHRFGLVPGDPAVEETEHGLARKPKICVPTIVLDGDADGVAPLSGSVHHDRFFTGRYERRVTPGVGHNLPQEAPRDFAEAVLSLV